MVSETVPVLGVDVDALTAADTIERITAAIRGGERLVVGHHNLHSVYLVHERPELRRFYERADVVYADGMPLVLASRLRGTGLRRDHRATLLDWIDPLLDRAVGEGWTVYLLGSAPGTIDDAVAALAARHPGVRLTSHHGYFDPDGPANAEVVADINRVRPQLLLVGMGMPRQELWLADNADALAVDVAMTVGGLFDYFAGVSATPPRWMGRVGLEWLGRLAADPGRLAHRYLVEPLLLARHLARTHAR